jgi:carbonic anhydrase
MSNRSRNGAWRRRALLRLGAGVLTGLAITPSCSSGVWTAMPARARSLAGSGPAAALRRLVEGNERFAAGAPSQADISAARRAELAGGQRPFAAIVSCADSRVPPEIIFDQGLGDLFVCRVAGNFVDVGITGSVEYAIDVLGVSLLFVLGHGSCGAVKAAVEAVAGGGPISPNIAVIVDDLRPAVERVLGQPGDVLANAIVENVRVGMARLNAEPVIAPSVALGSVGIAGGVYNLNTGVVDLLS